MAYSIIDDTEGVGYGYMWAIIMEGGEMEQMVGYPGFFHTGGGAQVLIIIPDLKLVIVALFDTDVLDEDWDDEGPELVSMIIDARID